MIQTAAQTADRCEADDHRACSHSDVMELANALLPLARGGPDREVLYTKLLQLREGLDVILGGGLRTPLDERAGSSGALLAFHEHLRGQETKRGFGGLGLF